MKFVLYNNMWYRYDESTPLNSATIIDNTNYVNERIDISMCDIIEESSGKNLNWNGTRVLKQSYLGWLNPDGKFFGCDETYHSEQAKLIHHTEEYKLENAGWIKITELDMGPYAFFNYSNGYAMITRAQYLYLSDNKPANFDQINVEYRRARHKMSQLENEFMNDNQTTKNKNQFILKNK